MSSPWPVQVARASNDEGEARAQSSVRLSSFEGARSALRLPCRRGAFSRTKTKTTMRLDRLQLLYPSTIRRPSMPTITRTSLAVGSTRPSNPTEARLQLHNMRVVRATAARPRLGSGMRRAQNVMRRTRPSDRQRRSNELRLLRGVSLLEHLLRPAKRPPIRSPTRHHQISTPSVLPTATRASSAGVKSVVLLPTSTRQHRIGNVNEWIDRS